AARAGGHRVVPPAGHGDDDRLPRPRRPPGGRGRWRAHRGSGGRRMTGAPWPGEFSFAFLRELLAIAGGRGDLRLLAAGVDAPGLIVRHDVDLSLERAVAVGAVERDAGVQATFLVMVDSPLYDLDAPGARAAVRELREQGHDVGLHMD